MKKIKRILSLSMALLIGFNTISSAREIEDLEEFRVTYNGRYTSFLTKGNDSNYVLNLRLSEDLAPHVVWNVLENSNGSRRSAASELRCGQRATYSNWASVGYNYRLKLARRNWWDFAMYIDGSWSPDSR